MNPILVHVPKHTASLPLVVPRIPSRGRRPLKRRRRLPSFALTVSVLIGRIAPLQLLLVIKGMFLIFGPSLLDRIVGVGFVSRDVGCAAETTEGPHELVDA